MTKSRIKLKFSKNQNGIYLKTGSNLVCSQDVFPDIVENFVLFCIHLLSECNIIIRTFTNFPLLIKQNDESNLGDGYELTNESLVNLTSINYLQIIPLKLDKSPSTNYFYFEEEEIFSPADEKINEMTHMQVEENLGLEDLEKIAQEEIVDDQNTKDQLRIESSSELIKQNLDTQIDSILPSVINDTENKANLDEVRTSPRTLDNNIILPPSNKNKIILDDEVDELKETKPQPRQSFTTPLKLTRSSSNLLNEGSVTLIEKKRKRPKPVVQEQPKLAPCSICLDPITHRSQLDKCEHEFCRECIDQWAVLSNSCPLCKIEFTKIVSWEADRKQEKKVKRRRFKYEEEEEEPWLRNCAENCMVCSKSNDEHLLLVCDKCMYNICHTYCAGLDLIPDDEWLCESCKNPNRRRVTASNLNNLTMQTTTRINERRSLNLVSSTNRQTNQVQTRNNSKNANLKQKYSFRKKK